MNTELVVALISSPVLVAALGAWRDARKARKDNESDHQVMAAKVDALAEDVADVKTDVHAMRAEHNKDSQRLAKIEGRFDDHLREREWTSRRRS